MADVGQTATAPAERLAAKPLNQNISRQARMTTISVRKWVNRDQAMVEPDRDLMELASRDLACTRLDYSFKGAVSLI
ncbi:hypothetical protein AM571_PC00227 (plasmid) [Rhizobium etli 8C-3]|uniref:Uncharacterized protein n=1 Tax=Rhizobium etli 8C-3 TaxID=538025 RepID=A0A1L5PCE9_RHIET|nr:hypothetical protein AM571_PC00227 [Rhizobium etli 8C-3]